MRDLIVISGIDAAVAGLAVAAHQAFQWLRDGYWPPVLFRDLWYALGGTAPDSLPLPGIGGIIAQLLEQPLSVVLFLAGVCIAWIAAKRTSRPWTRI